MMNTYEAPCKSCVSEKDCTFMTDPTTLGGFFRVLSAEEGGPLVEFDTTRGLTRSCDYESTKPEVAEVSLGPGVTAQQVGELTLAAV